jgi:hypothetical protein
VTQGNTSHLGGSGEEPRRWLSERTFIKAYRNPDALALLRSNKNAFCLLYVIALRARRCRDGFNEHHLAPGEAFLGDFESYGMTEKQYRVAKKFLQKHGYAAFRRASRGTVAKLIDSSIFDINAEIEGEHDGSQRADRGRVPGGGRATNNNGEECDNGKKVVHRVPLREEVLAYGTEILRKSEESCNAFYDFYNDINWLRDGKPVQWRAELRGWIDYYSHAAA